MPPARRKHDLLTCGDPRDGRPEVAYTSCGHLLCEDHAGPHECTTARHRDLPRWEKRGAAGGRT